MNDQIIREESEKVGKICPVPDAICDHLCGYPAHATIIRKNRCDCGGGLAPDLKGNPSWDEHSFKCESCGVLKTI